jgi:hypothetical protein
MRESAHVTIRVHGLDGEQRGNHSEADETAIDAR